MSTYQTMNQRWWYVKQQYKVGNLEIASIKLSPPRVISNYQEVKTTMPGMVATDIRWIRHFYPHTTQIVFGPHKNIKTKF